MGLVQLLLARRATKIAPALAHQHALYRTTVGTMSYMYVLWTVASAHKCEAPALWFDRLCVWTLGACL